MDCLHFCVEVIYSIQVVPRVGRPAVMLTVSKQTVMKKDETICNIKLNQHTSKCDRIVLKNVIMKFDSDSQKKINKKNNKKNKRSPHLQKSEQIVNYTKVKIVKENEKLANVMKGVSITNYWTKNFNLKIVVKKSTPVEKWVNCELQITIVTENGWDTIANVMKNVFMKFKRNPATHF